MKIRPPTPADYPKVSALLRQAFPGSGYEEQLVTTLRAHGKIVHEWVCIHTNSVIASITFTNAYRGSAVCGLHLAPVAVKPDFQRQGIGSGLLRFALRQVAVREKTVFVLGDPGFYLKLGFEPCSLPFCPFDNGNAHFLAIRNHTTSRFMVGYEPEFSAKPEKYLEIKKGKGNRRKNNRGQKA